MTALGGGSFDEFSDLTGAIIEGDDEDDDVFRCSLTLDEINSELAEITEAINNDLPYNEKRLDYLIKAQKHNAEYIKQQEEERLEWLESIYEFSTECLERVRTFVPVDVFTSSQKDLMDLGLSYDVSKRILQRQCLFLVRMSSAEIARLHEADLYGRYNCTAQHLDIIETAAIYASLPETFLNDPIGRKREWKEMVESLIKKMLLDNENETLPEDKIRAPVYEGLQFGPIKDTTSVRENKAVSSDGMSKPRRSYLDLCRSNSILFKAQKASASNDSNN